MWRLLLIFSVGCVCAAQSKDTEVERLFQEGVQQQRAGDLAAAISSYRQLLKIRNDVPPAYANLGAALAGFGRYQEAIANYQKALQSGDNPATRLNLALAFYKLGEFSQAAGEFARVLTTQPGNLQATELAGDSYLKLGENKRVIETVEPLATSLPDELALQYLLGTALIRDRQPQKGREALARILTHGENAGASLMMAEMAISDENYSEAKTDAQTAIKLDPKLPEAFMLNGLADEGLGDYTDARAAFEKSLRIDPSGFDSNLHLGALMLHDSQFEGAEQFTRRALQTRPASAAALYQLGLIDKANKRLSDAVKEFEAAEKLSPSWLQPHIQLASLYYRVQRPQDGIRERQAVSRLSESESK